MLLTKLNINRWPIQKSRRINYVWAVRSKQICNVNAMIFCLAHSLFNSLSICLSNDCPLVPVHSIVSLGLLFCHFPRKRHHLMSLILHFKWKCNMRQIWFHNYRAWLLWSSQHKRMTGVNKRILFDVMMLQPKYVTQLTPRYTYTQSDILSSIYSRSCGPAIVVVVIVCFADVGLR